VPPRPRELFAAYSWQAPAAPRTVTVAPPARPTAPPLPFVYAGRLVVAGKTTYLLVEGVRLHMAETGTPVGEFTLTAANPGALVFTHRPTGAATSLPLPP
jgi:hypothetical protein